MSSSSSTTELNNEETNAKKSALQDNIESKGKNAYYFAHAHKANGPKWDGKPQPRLLVKHSEISDENNAATNENSDSDAGDTASIEKETGDMQILSISNHAQSLIKGLKQGKSSFDFTKSNITKYAFLDESKKVKIYIDMKGVGDLCSNEDDVKLDWDERSFSLKVYNYNVSSSSDEGVSVSSNSDVQCLSFGKLHGFISKAVVKVKKDRIILTLTKKIEDGEDPEEWPSIAQKGDDE